jgi:lipopolysaccharide transport system ATP-binding protein
VNRSIITVENLSKRYSIGHQRAKGDGLRHSIEQAVRNPVSWLWGRRKRFARQRSEEFWALKNVSFEIKEGEVVGIIGRNGAGKSTLLKILSRITEPTTGRIHISGRVASLLEVGTGFHPELTGRENIFLNGAILGMRKTEIKAKFDEIVAFSEIERFLDTPVKRYSSGMYVRLAFAVAAHLEPEILIVDEVLAVGDAGFQKKCLGKMQDVSQGGRTVIFVSHNMGVISHLCNQVILLGGGQMKYQGNTRQGVELYMRPENEQLQFVDLNLAERQLSILGRVRVTKATSEPSSGLPSWQFYYQSPIAFQIDFTVKKTINELCFGFALHNDAGFEIASSLSTHKLKSISLSAGRYFLSVAYPALGLLPGRYRIGMSIRSDLGFEDYLSEAFWFEVLPNELAGEHRTQTFGGALVPGVNYQLGQR